jgi:hypothetical protein
VFVETQVLMNKEKASSLKEIAPTPPMLHVPGLKQVIEILRQEFPLLSEEAIARILGLPGKDTHTIEQKSDTPERCKPKPVVEVPE